MRHYSTPKTFRYRMNRFMASRFVQHLSIAASCFLFMGILVLCDYWGRSGR